MKFTLKAFVSGLALVLSSSAYLGAQAETISDAVGAALVYHPQIAVAKAQVDIAEEEESSEFSGYFPLLSMSASGGRMYGDNATTRGLTTTRGATYSNLWEASVSARQPLFDGFETLNRVRAAEAQKKSADMSLLNVNEQISYRTTQAFLEVAQARVGLGMLNKHREKVEDYVQRIENNVAQGGSDEAELKQAKDVIAILDGFINDYEGQLRIAEAQYAEMTGHAPGFDMKNPNMSGVNVPANELDAMSLAIETHPSLQAAKLQTKAVDRQIDAEQGILYPDIDGELSYLQSDKKEEIGGEVEDARAVVRLNWDLEMGGGQLARIRQKKHEYEQSLARERELEHQIKTQIDTAYAQMMTAQKQFENDKERFKLNKELLETYNVQFQGGRVTLLQLMQADNQLFNTKLEAIMSQYRLLSSQYAILASMGRLKDTLLQTAAVEYVPEQVQGDGQEY